MTFPGILVGTLTAAIGISLAPSPALAAGPAGPAAASGPAPTAAAAEALRALFAQEDPPEATKQLDAVLAACSRDPAALRRAIAADTAYEPYDAGWHTRRLRYSDGGKDYEVEFGFQVPPGYRTDRPHAVLLAAHGQGSNGKQIAYSTLRTLGAAAADYIVLAPTMPGPPSFGGQSYQEQAYLHPLAWLRRNLNVDDDRICLTGYSQGGHCTWHLAVLFPRHFAAAVSMAGTPWFEGAPHTANLYLENLAHLPLWAIWGELDKPAPPAIGQVHFCRAATARLKELGNAGYRGTELAGVGHDGCRAEPHEFVGFLAAGRRIPAPDKLTHFFHLDHHRRGYWLEAVDLAGKPLAMDKPIRIPFSRTGGDPQGDKAAEAFFARQLFKMWGELDRSANAAAIRTSRIRTVRIYMMEGMFDLARPVTLRFGSRPWRGLVKPSAECMLRHYAADRDATALILNEIDFSDAGRAVVRYP